MVRRIVAALGLLGFAIALVGGLLAGNSFEFVLSRALLALILFCALGLVVGAAAHCVVREHHAAREHEVLGPQQPDIEPGTPSAPADNSIAASS